MTALCNGANVWSSEKSRSTLLVWCVTDWKVRCATPQASWSTQNLPTGCWVTSLKLGSAVKNIGRQGQTAVPKLTNWHWSQTATTSPSHAYLGGLTAVHLKGGHLTNVRGLGCSSVLWLLMGGAVRFTLRQSTCLAVGATHGRPCFIRWACVGSNLSRKGGRTPDRFLAKSWFTVLNWWKWTSS